MQSMTCEALSHALAVWMQAFSFDGGRRTGGSPSSTDNVLMLPSAFAADNYDLPYAGLCLEEDSFNSRSEPNEEVEGKVKKLRTSVPSGAAHWGLLDLEFSVSTGAGLAQVVLGLFIEGGSEDAWRQ